MTTTYRPTSARPLTTAAGLLLAAVAAVLAVLAVLAISALHHSGVASDFRRLPMPVQQVLLGAKASHYVDSMATR